MKFTKIMLIVFAVIMFLRSASLAEGYSEKKGMYKKANISLLKADEYLQSGDKINAYLGFVEAEAQYFELYETYRGNLLKNKVDYLRMQIDNLDKTDIVSDIKEKAVNDTMQEDLAERQRKQEEIRRQQERQRRIQEQQNRMQEQMRRDEQRRREEQQRQQFEQWRRQDQQRRQQEQQRREEQWLRQEQQRRQMEQMRRINK